MFRLSALTVGIVLDWILGEPRWLLHPVVLMGRLIGRTEAWLQKARPGKEESSGVLLVLIVLLLGLLVPGGILAAAAWWEKGRGPLCWSLCAFWSFQLLAARSLYRESGKVREALEQEDEGRARKALSMIVGRDVERLDQAGIVRAGVETVAENTSDGVVAPMLYIAAFGILGGFFYKAVNTMDSMVGYKDERYRLFGRAAARLDDLCNLLPARITGCLLVLAAHIAKLFSPVYDGKAAWRIYMRDRRAHPSPNSAHGEAACAGALHIRLAGPAWYFGTLHEKPYIGDDDRPVEAEDIRRAGKLMAGAQLLGLLAFWGGWSFLQDILSRAAF